MLFSISPATDSDVNYTHAHYPPKNIHPHDILSKYTNEKTMNLFVVGAFI